MLAYFELLVRVRQPVGRVGRVSEGLDDERLFPEVVAQNFFDGLNVKPVLHPLHLVLQDEGSLAGHGVRRERL